MSTIITRNSANSGSTPSSLVQGELAINVTDGRLFYGSGSGNIVKEFVVSGSGGGTINTGSFVTTSSFNNYTGSNTSQFAGTASFALSASYAISASYEINYETSSSYADFAVSASHASTASYYNEKDPIFVAKSASLATTGSNTFIGNQTISGSIYTDGTITFSGQPFISSTYPSGNIYISALNDGILHLNDDGGEGDIWMLNGQNKLRIEGDTIITGSLYSTNIIGTGSLFLQPNQSDARFIEIYNTSPTDTHLTASGGQIFIGDDVTYVKVDNYGSVKYIDIVADNGLTISASIVKVTGSLYQLGTFYPDQIDWFSSSIGYDTGSYILTTTANGLTTYANYQDVATIINNGLLTTSSFNAYTGSNTSQFAGTASYAISASYEINYETSSSYADFAVSASYALTASNILGGKATHVPYFITDTTLATSSIYQSGSSTVIINQDNATSANPEALYVWQPSTSSFNVISGKGNLNNYLQLNIQNTNQGTNASSDVVATADNGNENTNYIDMGINGENYNAGFIGGVNDAYLYSTGRHLHIGNVSNFPVQIFAGGSDVDIHNKLELSPDNQHLMSGSLDVSGSVKAFSFTGSLQGNATSATTSQTSSYSTTLGASLSQPANNQVRLLNSAGGTLSTVTVNNVTSASHADNASTADYAAIAGNGGVTQLIAGSGVTLIPPSGLGNVTVIATGTGGITIISGSLVTGSFTNTTSFTFNHNLNTRTPIITVFDSNYNQIIPENIQLVNTASAIITFPTQESGFAIGSTGGTTGTALSSSYALFAGYANTASFYAETDPVFVAKSASLATTGSNIFRGNQIITGSILMSGSSYISGVDYIDFDTTASNIGAVSRLKWNDTDGTLDLGLKGGNVTLQIGQEEVVRVVNKTGVNLTEAGYEVVRLDGAQGNRIKVALAKGDGDANSLDTLGLVTENIAINGEGFVTSYGLVRSIDTRGVLQGETWADGDALYLSPTIFGGITNIPPTAPSHSVRLGYVVQSSPNGSIFVKVDNGYELDELHNVLINTSSLAYGDLLMRDGNNVWINSKQLSGSYSITGSLTVSGSSTFTNIGLTSLTGSLNVTGSTTQTGNNTLIGNTTLSGSINVSGSQNFIGSSSFYGTHLLSGSNTIIGNTFMFGDIEVSGSSNFNNSEFIVTGSTSILGNFNVKGTSTFSDTTFTITGSQLFSGSSFINGNQSITGSLNVIGNINVISGSSFTRWGNKLFNYGQFANTASIPATANVSASFTLPLTYFNDGVSIISGSRITFANTGLYNIQYSALAQQGNATPSLRIWFRKTGSNIDNSGTIIQLQNNSQTAVTSQFLQSISASEYVELWYHSSGANTSFPYNAAGSGFPATPSITVTVTQIA